MRARIARAGRRMRVCRPSLSGLTCGSARPVDRELVLLPAHVPTAAAITAFPCRINGPCSWIATQRRPMGHPEKTLTTPYTILESWGSRPSVVQSRRDLVLLGPSVILPSSPSPVRDGCSMGIGWSSVSAPQGRRPSVRL